MANFLKGSKATTMFHRYTGFTLAEVLITLGIIGVVAAMTVPILMNSTRNLQYKVAVKKTFSVLASAVEQAVHESGGGLDSGHTTIDELLNILKPYMLYTKECAQVATDKCLANSYKYLDGTAADGSWVPNGEGLILNDGSVITGWGGKYSSNCTYGYTAIVNNLCGAFMIDVNGIKPPNQFGVDTFVAFVLKDRLIPTGATGAEGEYSDHYCPTYGLTCLNNVLSNINY